MYPFSISDHVIVTTTATDPDQGAERIAAALNRLLAENVVREGSAVRFFHEQSLGGISRRLMQPWFFGVGGSVGTRTPSSLPHTLSLKLASNDAQASFSM